MGGAPAHFGGCRSSYSGSWIEDQARQMPICTRVGQIPCRGVRDFATPSSLTVVRWFDGMAPYCRRFIKSFAEIVAPLHDLTKERQRECWIPLADKAFNSLKHRLCLAPLLSLPNFFAPFTINTDASDSGLRAVWSKRKGAHEYVIAYASQTFTPVERNY